MGILVQRKIPMLLLLHIGVNEKMTSYIQKLIQSAKPMYFYWEDILIDFIGYYRAIFRASDGKLYLFRCFFSDTNIAREPLKLFLSDDNDLSKMSLDSIGHLTRISSFQEGKTLYALSKEKLHSLQQTLETALIHQLNQLLLNLPNTIKVEIKIFWKPVISISCYILVNEQLAGILLLLKRHIIPLNGDAFYISQVIQMLQPFWKQNNLLLKGDNYVTE